MNAEEARKIAKKNLKGRSIEKYLECIDSRILQAAKEGRFHIPNPEKGITREGCDFFLSFIERKSARTHYERLGFKWKGHEEPGYDSPFCGPHTTLEW